MANRNMPNRSFSNTRDRVTIDAKVTFGTSGAPTLAANGFVKSVTRDAQGKFTFAFGTSNALDPYYVLVGARVVFNTSGVGSGVAAAAPVLQVIANNISDSTKASVQVMLTCLDTPAATDPASAEIGHFTFEFGNSSAGN